MIVPSRKAILWWAIFLMPLLALPVASSLFSIVLICDAIVLVLMIIDGRLKLHENIFQVERVKIDRYYHLSEQDVKIKIRNTTKQTLSFIFYDSPPASFLCTGNKFEGTLKPFETREYSYTVIPQERGDFSFGAIDICAEAKWSAIYISINSKTETSVYPSIDGVRHYDAIMNSRASSKIGEHILRQVGQGREFDALRPYARGDDYRLIHWKATARHRVPITQTFRIERSQNVLICLDVGRLMRASADNKTKLDAAIDAVLFLAYACVREEDNVGLILFSDEVHAFIPPACSSSQLSIIMDTLYATTPRRTESDYLGLVKEVCARQTRRSLVIVLSEFPHDDPEGITALSYLAPKHVPLALTLGDASITQLATANDVNLSGLYDKITALEILQTRQEIAMFLRLRGVYVSDLQSENLAVEAVNAYLNIKDRQIV